MPNPNPTRRTRRPAAQPAEVLPPGMTRRAGGLIMYRWTDRGVRQVAYGRTPDECLAKRYAPTPEPVKVDERTTLADYLELWLEGLALRPNTIDGHRYNVERYLVPLFGRRVRLADVTRELVEARLAELRTYTTRSGRPLAPRTVALAFSTLRAAMNAAVDRRRIAFNPCARINPNATGSAGRSRRVGVELAIPTELELRRVIRATAGEPLALLLKLSASTGLRQSEALGLGVDDLDLELRFVHVHRSLRRHDRTLDDPKNASSSRYVGIPAALVPELRELVASQRAAGRELLFTTERGEPLVGSTVSHWWSDACARAGVTRYRWHDLRHAYASRLINGGTPIAVVAKRLGHADVTITSRTYHHVIRDGAALDDAELAGTVLAM